MRIPLLTRALEQARLQGAKDMAEAVAAAQAGEAERRMPTYLYENPHLFRPLTSPKKKPLQILGADDLRRLANAFDVLRLPIEHLKREALAVKWRIAPRDKRDDSDRILKRCKRAEEFFSTTGGNGEFGKPRSRFERMLLDDLLILGSFAVARSYDGGGRLVQQTAFDAATIAMRIDEKGWPDRNYPYQQWVLGRPIGNPLTEDDVYYSGIHASTTSPYYASPIEWILAPIAGGMAADEWNRSFFEGDHPGGWAVKFDPSLRPEQVTQFMGYIREALTGDTVAKRSLLPLPAGAEVVTEGARKDQDFETFQLLMLRRVLAIYGVTASSIGFAGEQYKVTQEGSNEQTTRFGVQPLIGALKELYDDTLDRLGFADLEAVEAGDDESIQDLAPSVVQLVGAGILNVNEGRKRLGYEPVEGGDEFPDEREDEDPFASAGGDDEDDTDERVERGAKDQLRGPDGRFIPMAKIDEFVAKALGDKAFAETLTLGRIGKTVGKRIHALSGVDVTGFALEFQADDVRHVMKKHGSNEPKGQRNFTPKDFHNVVRAVVNPDTARASVTKTNENALRIGKSIGSEDLITVQVVGSRKRRLALRTAYIKTT